MARRACLAIGVSTVLAPPKQTSGFAYLDGAVIAARAIGDWARSAGFGDDNVRVVDDEPAGTKPNPVTRERVQQAVDELFPPGAEVVEHLILAYCGHGLTDQQVNSVSWLFSDALRGKYRVVVDRFYTELLLHGVQRITLISDACREAPKGLDLLRLDPVRGIVVQGAPVARPKLDRLTACQDGQLGFMVADPASAAPGKCLFSGVIVDALWGDEPTAIDDGRITTSTLSTCVEVRAGERARAYRLTLEPDCMVNATPALLCTVGSPPTPPRALQPWPPLNAASSVLGAADPVAPDGQAGHVVDRVNEDSVFRRWGFGGDSVFATDDGRDADGQPFVFHDRSKGLLRKLAALRRRHGRVAGREQMIEVLVRQLETEVAVDAAVDARQFEAEWVVDSLAHNEPSGRMGNLVVVGGCGSLMSGVPVSGRRPSSASEALFARYDRRGMPLLVELAHGAYAQVVPYGRMYAVVVPTPDGGVYQAYGDRHLPGDYERALDAVAALAMGRLGVDSLKRLVGRLPRGSDLNPTLAVISAYLYRSIADFDSIRRMAYGFAARRRPVPFDIALLGAMPVTRMGDGTLQLHVPAAGAGARGKGYVAWPGGATGAVRARVGGRCPWLGLGWDYVTDPRPEWAPLVEGLGEHAGKVRRSGFTVLPKAAARKFAEAWGLRQDS